LVVFLDNCKQCAFNHLTIFSSNYLYFIIFRQRLFRRSSRELKRLYSISKSPVFASFAEMLDGCVTIRAHRAEARLVCASLKQV
jgi:hypothetical protein